MKKIKLTLNKTTVSRLQDDQQAKVFGGEQPPTTQATTCLKETDYPICGWSGCIGPASCCSVRDQSCDITRMTEDCIITEDCFAEI